MKNNIDDTHGLKLNKIKTGCVFALLFGISVVAGCQPYIVLIFNNTKDLFLKISTGSFLLLASYILGTYIDGIRYGFGFVVYPIIHLKNKTRKYHHFFQRVIFCFFKKVKIRKCHLSLKKILFKSFKKVKAKKHYTLFQRIIFYLFRDGTVVEMCLYEKRKYKEDNNYQTYDWIKNSGKELVSEMWVKAKQINRRYPDENIYESYFQSEFFQYFDTISILLTICNLIILGVNISLNLLGINKQLSLIFVPIIFVIIFIFMHKISRICAKGYAKRFFNAIHKSLMAENIRTRLILEV